MQHKKRKKIYSEQLLQIHEDSKKIHPGKEIYATGYVIELKKDCYFAGFQDGKILCRSFEYGHRYRYMQDRFCPYQEKRAVHSLSSRRYSS